MAAWPREDGGAWALEMQRRVFCVTLGVFSLALSFIVGRSWLEGGQPWADTFSLIALFVILLVAPRHPEIVRILMWLTLGAMLLDVIDGILPAGARVVTPTHIFLPTLMLYGAVLGEMTMILVTGAVVLAIYGLTWHAHSPLTPEDAAKLGNLMVVTAGTGLLGYAVWMQGREWVRALQQRADDLRHQLDANQRLTAVLSHDIVNPLHALQGTLDMARSTGAMGEADLALAERMTERMTAIIACVRELNHDADFLLPVAPVTVQKLWSDLVEVFKQRLAAKNQRFVLTSGFDLRLNTNDKILNASVLGNLLTNACKFSPSGAVIEMSARCADRRVRISIHNPGSGFTAEQIRGVNAGQAVGSQPGTEGEKGDGNGLRIARYYLHRLQGELEVANEPAGAVTTVILPEAP
jgi:signal transduction histidine kinase